jgi:hypothetical protein
VIKVAELTETCAYNKIIEEEGKDREREGR